MTAVYVMEVAVGCLLVLTAGYFKAIGLVMFAFMIASLAIGMRVAKNYLLVRYGGRSAY